jgi:hypothetical protein
MVGDKPMLEFYGRDEGCEAYISNDYTGSYEIIDDDEEYMVNKVFTAIDQSAIELSLKGAIKQAVLRVLVLGE